MEEFAKKKKKRRKSSQARNAAKHGRYYEEDIEELITGVPTTVFIDDEDL